MKRRSHYRALIALGLIPAIGNRRITGLLNEFPDASGIFREPAARLQGIDGIGSRLAGLITAFDRWDEADRILNRSVKAGSTLIACDDSDYPPLLRQIFDSPPLLWYKGNPEALAVSGIAVIGTRKPDRYGIGQAERWTSELVQAGLAVHSGLAWGIDAVAHQTALKKGGLTVGVLGTGIDRIYPANHAALVRQMLDSGSGVLTEFPPGTGPEPGNFPARNRIVSGMSLGVLVVQSGVKGGSMITARAALDQNREVFVIPHSLGCGSGEGCNNLIKTGQGKLVEEIEDLLVEISVDHPVPARPAGEVTIAGNWRSEVHSEGERAVCEALETGGMHIDRMLEVTGYPAGELLQLLLNLEMEGVIRQRAGRYFELHP